MDTLPFRLHPVAPLLCHAAKHEVPVALLCRMDIQEKQEALCYETHASALKEDEFIYSWIADQVQAGHMDVFRVSHPKYVNFSYSILSSQFL